MPEYITPNVRERMVVRQDGDQLVVELHDATGDMTGEPNRRYVLRDGQWYRLACLSSHPMLDDEYTPNYDQLHTALQMVSGGFDALSDAQEEVDSLRRQVDDLFS